MRLKKEKNKRKKKKKDISEDGNSRTGPRINGEGRKRFDS